MMTSQSAIVSSESDDDYRTTRIETLKEAPSPNMPTFSSQPKARRRRSLNVKKYDSIGSSNSCLPLHQERIRSTSATRAVKSPSAFLPSRIMQNPLSAVLSSRKGKDVLPYKYSTKKNSRVNKYFAIFGFVLILAACFSYKRKFVVQEKMNKHVQENSRNVETLSKTVQEMNTEIGLHLKRMETLKLTNTDLKRAKEELERNRDELKVNVGNGMKTKDDIKMLGENQDLKNEVENLKANDSNASLLMNRLIDKVQRDSYRDVFERFGPGPHLVKFDVAIPGKGFNPSTFSSFTIRLHPINVMPHTVHLFLEQVYHGLWDDCAFVIKSPEVIQIGDLPKDSDGKTHKEKMMRFEDLGLSKIHFQEYNKDYPHKKWTVGLAGRPGGPDFYVNMKDNSKLHGPGGQKHYKVSEEADPCFGEVVEGRDTLDIMYSLPVDSNNFKPVLEKPVLITKATIVNMAETLAGADDQHVATNMKDKHFTET